MKQKLLKTMLLLWALVAGSVSVFGQTTYKLTEVTSVSAGNKYVFVRDGHAFGSTVASNALQTVSSYNTKGLAGTEAYVWTLEEATGGFYMKNVSLASNQYLNNASGKTNMSFGSKSSVWAFEFSSGTAKISNTSNSNRFLGDTAGKGNTPTHTYKAYATSNLDKYDYEITVYLLEEETTDPTINASNVEYEAEDTEGEIAYTIDNPDGISTLVANTSTTWISNIAVTASKVTFDMEENTGALRNGTITLSYTGATNKVITVTQKAPVVKYNVIFSAMTNGSVVADKAKYEEDETVTLTITPSDGYELTTITATDEDAGSITLNGEGTTRTFTMPAKDVTVSATFSRAQTPILTLDFATNILSLPEGSSNKVTASTGYTYNGYTYTLAAADGFYYNASDKYVILGKTGSTFTFPAFPYNVTKIKVYGRTGASGAVVQNIYVGDEAVSTATTGATGTNEYEIASGYQAAGNVYVLKVTSAHNTQITKIEVFGNVAATITSVGFATLYTPIALDFSEVAGLTAYTATKDGDVVRLTPVDNVQANTGVVLEGAANTYEIPVASTSSTAKGELTGNASAATAWNAESGYTYYVLASTGSGVEFRPVTEGEIAAGKAYLKVASASVHSYSVIFGDDDANAIVEVANEKPMNGVIFDLSGRRVSKAVKGIYIVNGKKIVK